MAAGLTKGRLEALADGIFAVAMTLLVLDIKIPDNLTYATDAALWNRLAGLQHHFASYLVSFLVLGMYWVSHHYHFHFVRSVDRGLIWINLLLLLAISFVPFSTDMLGDSPELRLPPIVYGLNLVAIAAAFFAHTTRLVHCPHLAAPEFTPEALRTLRRVELRSALVPLAAIAASFYSPRLSLYIYLSLIILHFLPGRIDPLTRPSDGRDEH